jgi:plasmid stabilization system protein ParE
MKIIWTDEAVSDLENIFDYYLTEASLQVANRIVNNIVDALIISKSNQTRDKERLSLMIGNMNTDIW